MRDLIDRQAALRTDCFGDGHDGLRAFHVYEDYLKMRKYLESLPSAQPEQSLEIQDILEYLDTVLHPIVSPDHWNVYSELHDMISMLPSAQPKRKKGKWINGVCDQCGSHAPYWAMASTYYRSSFCPNCGADMRGEQDE